MPKTKKRKFKSVPIDLSDLPDVPIPEPIEVVATCPKCGRSWAIWKSDEYKRIHKSELSKYLADGWKFVNNYLSKSKPNMVVVIKEGDFG